MRRNEKLASVNEKREATILSLKKVGDCFNTSNKSMLSHNQKHYLSRWSASLLTYPLMTTVLFQGLEDVTNQLIKAKMSSFKQEQSHSPTGREQHVQQLHQKLNAVTDDLYGPFV